MKNITESALTPSKSATPLSVAYIPINSLKFASRNPRVHPKKQIQKIADSIRTFGFLIPAIIDDKNQIICGEARINAAKLVGLTEVPTIPIAHLTDPEIKAFRITDNRLTEIAVWDDQMLVEELKELSMLDLEFSLETTGFEMGEIDLMIENLKHSPQNAEDPTDTQILIPTGPAISKIGDLWLLERHRLYCGNALENDSYNILMAEERAAMVISDPPYNVPVNGHVCGNGAVQHREFTMASGEMSEPEFISFLKTSFGLMAQYSVDGSIHFLFMDWRHAGEILIAGNEVYDEHKNIIVWVKDNAGLGTFYRSQHELIFVFKRGNNSHRNNFQLGQFGRHRTNVWNYPGVNSFARKCEQENLLEFHPTVKPVAMIADAIMDCSARDDIILDSFLGSGTSILAAERVGRRCYGIEIDPIYVDTAIRRWQKQTGKDAIHAETGKTFEDLTKSMKGTS